jgi:hypothetical protein
MRDSMTRQDGQTELNKVQTRMAKVQTALNSPVETGSGQHQADMLSLIEGARRRSGLKLEYLASLSGISKGQLSGALNGNGGFNVKWMDPWPQEFWDEFSPALRAERESTPASVRARRFERLKAAISDLIDIAEVSA